MAGDRAGVAVSFAPFTGSPYVWAKAVLPLLLLAAGGSALLPAGCAYPGWEYEEADRLYRETLHELSRAKDPGDALPLLDRAIQLDPERPEFFTARALLLRILGQLEDAAEDYTDAIALQKRLSAPAGELATSYLNRGILRAETKHFHEAEADFAEALGLFPDYVEAYLHRARFRRLSGRAEEADRDVADARRIGGPLADTFTNEGVRVLNLGRSEEAQRLFGFALDLDPGNARALVGQARMALERGQFALAADALGRAIALRPHDADLYYHRANALLALSRFQEALADYTSAVERDPGQSSFYASRGIVYHRHLRDHDRAEQEYNRALVLDPQSYTALLNRGLLYHEMKLLHDAERDLREALALHASAEGVQHLGRILLDKGDYAKADDAFRKALEICREDTRRKSLEEDLERTRQAVEKERAKER